MEDFGRWVEDWFEQNSSPYYILKNGKIKPASLMEWALWFEDHQQRRIDMTDISGFEKYPKGEMVSTVFLGIDHGLCFESWKEHKPILFESMIFGGEYHNRGWRYSSLGEAKLGHWQIVDGLREGNPPAIDFGERPWMETFLEMFNDDGQPGEREREPEENAGPGESD